MGEFERMVDVTGAYTLDFGLGDHDTLRFYMETAHVEFSREELLAAFYAAQKGKAYEVRKSCSECGDTGGMLSSRKHATKDEWTIGFLFFVKSKGYEYRVAMSQSLFTQAILHSIL